MNAIHCQHCGRELNEEKAVMLELNNKDNNYYEFVPAEDSQGGFWFGCDCAKKILLRKELKKIEKEEK